MSKWRFGCGKKLTIFVARGFGFRELEAECGSTAPDGGVNQCDACAEQHPTLSPLEDEGDMEWYERNAAYYEDDFDGGGDE